MSNPTTPCPTCNFPMVWSEEAPGPSGYRCKVCELKVENNLLRESRRKLAQKLTNKELINWEHVALNAMESLEALGVDLTQMITSTPEVLERFGQYQRDKMSYG